MQFWPYQKYLPVTMNPQHHCMFSVRLPFIVSAEIQGIVHQYVVGYNVCLLVSHNYIHDSSLMFDVDRMWIMFQKVLVHLQIIMCFVLGSEQCITRLFSRLIDEQVIWEFLGAYLHKPFKGTFSPDSHTISTPFPPTKKKNAD